MSNPEDLKIKVVAIKAVLAPFSQIGAAYCCLKTLLWLVHQMEDPPRHAIMEHLLAIADELMGWEETDDGREEGK